MEILITPLINTYPDYTLLGTRRIVTDIIAIHISHGNLQRVYFNSDCNLSKALKQPVLVNQLIKLFGISDLSRLKEDFKSVAFRYEDFKGIFVDLVNSTICGGDVYVRSCKEVSIISELLGEPIYSIEQKEYEAILSNKLSKSERKLHKIGYELPLPELSSELRSFLNYLKDL